MGPPSHPIIDSLSTFSEFIYQDQGLRRETQFGKMSSGALGAQDAAINKSLAHDN